MKPCMVQMHLILAIKLHAAWPRARLKMHFCFCMVVSIIIIDALNSAIRHTQCLYMNYDSAKNSPASRVPVPTVVYTSSN